MGFGDFRFCFHCAYVCVCNACMFMYVHLHACSFVYVYALVCRHMEAKRQPRVSILCAAYLHHCVMLCWVLGLLLLLGSLLLFGELIFLFISLVLVWVGFFLLRQVFIYPRLALNSLCSRRWCWTADRPPPGPKCWNYKCMLLYKLYKLLLAAGATTLLHLNPSMQKGGPWSSHDAWNVSVEQGHLD